jgi:thiamine pyrophosphokinase
MKIKTIAIIAGGTISDRPFHQKVLAKANLIICADSGADNAVKLGVIPNYVIGDLDSISYTTLQKLQKIPHCRILFDHNQNKTDLELAIALAQSFNPAEVIILGAIGDNLDHTLANLICLDKIRRDISAYIIDNRHEIHLVDKSITLRGKKGDIVSVITLMPVKNLKYSGLKWDPDNINSVFGWFGIRNRMTKSSAEITVDSGKILVIKITARKPDVSCPG